MNGVIGTIWMFGGNFAPRNWALCDGQLLAISQFSALFSILGTTYGGDGRTTFGLPAMRGRIPMHEGNGPGLTNRRLGERGGQENVTLTTAEIPSHSHPTSILVNNTDGEEDTVAGKYLSNNAGAYNEDPVPNQTLAGPTGGAAGGGQSHNNVMPYIAVNFVICLVGIFPSRS
ncbi:MAG: tail fiber protein [Bacteroidota bacterium]